MNKRVLGLFLSSLLIVPFAFAQEEGVIKIVFGTIFGVFRQIGDAAGGDAVLLVKLFLLLLLFASIYGGLHAAKAFKGDNDKPNDRIIVPITIAATGIAFLGIPNSTIETLMKVGGGIVTLVLLGSGIVVIFFITRMIKRSIGGVHPIPYHSLSIVMFVAAGTLIFLMKKEIVADGGFDVFNQAVPWLAFAYGLCYVLAGLHAIALVLSLIGGQKRMPAMERGAERTGEFGKWAGGRVVEGGKWGIGKIAEGLERRRKAAEKAQALAPKLQERRINEALEEKEEMEDFEKLKAHFAEFARLMGVLFSEPKITSDRVAVVLSQLDTVKESANDAKNNFRGVKKRTNRLYNIVGDFESIWKEAGKQPFEDIDVKMNMLIEDHRVLDLELGKIIGSLNQVEEQLVRIRKATEPGPVDTKTIQFDVQIIAAIGAAIDGEIERQKKVSTELTNLGVNLDQALGQLVEENNKAIEEAAVQQQAAQ